MKKIKKFLRLERITLQAEEEHPHNVSRVHFLLLNGQTTYSTTRYGDVLPASIIWEQTVEVPYTAQQCIKFETKCQHEYGYELTELKALYSGIIYVKPEHFFRQNAIPAFDQSGKQCATLKFMLKAIQREQNVVVSAQQVFEEPKEAISIDMVGKISFTSARLVIYPLYASKFYRKKRTLTLQLRLDGNMIAGRPLAASSEDKWNLKGTYQLKLNSSQTISITILHQEITVLQGIMHLGVIEKERRFLVHKIPMFDQFETKIGVLEVELRYVSKLQLLDLMYSPRKLELEDITACARENHFETKREPSLSVPFLKKKKAQIGSNGKAFRDSSPLDSLLTNRKSLFKEDNFWRGRKHPNKQTGNLSLINPQDSVIHSEMAKRPTRVRLPLIKEVLK